MHFKHGSTSLFRSVARMAMTVTWTFVSAFAGGIPSHQRADMAIIPINGQVMRVTDTGVPPLQRLGPQGPPFRVLAPAAVPRRWVPPAWGSWDREASGAPGA